MKFNRLKRKLNPMRAHVRKLLNEKGLMNAYKARPPYQQNDYIGWIKQARQEATRQKRLDQMIHERQHLYENGMETEMVIFYRPVVKHRVNHRLGEF